MKRTRQEISREIKLFEKKKKQYSASIDKILKTLQRELQKLAGK